MYFLVKNCQKTFKIACNFTRGNPKGNRGKKREFPFRHLFNPILFLEKKNLPGIFPKGIRRFSRFTGPGLRNYIPARPFQYCTGQGGTLEEAEQDAARKALQSIRASDSEVARVFA